MAASPAQRRPSSSGQRVLGQGSEPEGTSGGASLAFHSEVLCRHGWLLPASALPGGSFPVCTELSSYPGPALQLHGFLLCGLVRGCQVLLLDAQSAEGRVSRLTAQAEDGGLDRQDLTSSA